MCTVAGKCRKRSSRKRLNKLRHAENGNTDNLKVVCFNMFSWTPARADEIMGWDGDVFALQETKLDRNHLDNARRFCSARQWNLYHGMPSPTCAKMKRGNQLGVGILSSPGLALQPVKPNSPTWTRVNSMGRVVVAKLPPSDSLPRGLWIASVYAPLQGSPQREAFNTLFWELVCEWDMQTPVVMLGDWNGSFGDHQTTCPLLMKLIGPGGPFADAHDLVRSEVQFTYYSDGGGTRIDRILVNGAAQRLVVGAGCEWREWGHCPLWVKLNVKSPKFNWYPPRKRLPDVLHQPTSILEQDEKWIKAKEKLTKSQQWDKTLRRLRSSNLDVVSESIQKCMDFLVQEVGGWTEVKIQRKAYSSKRVRDNAARINTLRKLLGSIQDGVGSWSRQTTEAISQLKKLKISLSTSNAVDLKRSAKAKLWELTRENKTAIEEMRKERKKRWKDNLPKMWKESPGRIYRFIRSQPQNWWASPVLRGDRKAAETPEEVDKAMRSFWVSKILRQDNPDCAREKWEAYSKVFGQFIRRTDIPTQEWTTSRVLSTFKLMNSNSSPGYRGIPISTWKAAPDEVIEAIAHLLNLVEKEGRWPKESTSAYICVLPKTEESAEPGDFRPITVLDVIYRLWARGVVELWKVPLQQEILSECVMGFREERGCTHLAQLVQDIVDMSDDLWLVSFDIQKCYDTLPWWALFGTISAYGVPNTIVKAFETMYTSLERRFRYGRWDGEAWTATNGLAQGCPASPDLLNFLYEPFHRWAQSTGRGVSISLDSLRVVLGTASYADDLVIMANSWEDASKLVEGFLEWCKLLGLKVNLKKTQVWSKNPKAKPVKIGEDTIQIRPTFKVVGIEIGSNEKAACDAHIAKRMEKAAAALSKLKSMGLPTPIFTRVWQTGILPLLTYGCEIRETSSTCDKLTTKAVSAYASTTPISLSRYRASEVVRGPVLGALGLKDIKEEIRTRQARWMTTLVNNRSIVGNVHRGLCCKEGEWRWEETSKALSAMLQDLEVSVHVNRGSKLIGRWPFLHEESRFNGVVVLTPRESVPEDEEKRIVFTDGSVEGQVGGAAAWRRDTELSHTIQISNPCSSTECELVGLIAGLSMAPEMLVTDSLTALHWIGDWGRKSLKETLACQNRDMVRQFIAEANQLSRSNGPITLQKVKAHDEGAIAAGKLFSVGNNVADGLAKQAVSCGARWVMDSTYDDAVIVRCGSERLSKAVVQEKLWSSRRKQVIERRVWMPNILSEDADWKLSTACFRSPTVGATGFIYQAPPTTLKWVARIRTGALSTRSRFRSNGTEDEKGCVCCKEGVVENEEHVLFSCQASGADKWLEHIWSAWDEAHQKVFQSMTVAPPLAWWEKYRWMLRVGIIPKDTTLFLDQITSSTEAKAKFLKRFHLNLCNKLAELMHNRGMLMSAAEKEAKNRKDEEDKAPKFGPDTKLTGARKRREDVRLWIENHKHLAPTMVDEGTPTAMLVKLWEFDRKTELNVAARSDGRKDGCFSTMLTTITKHDPRMAEWLKSKKVHTQHVTTVLWSVKILPTVGERFWKEWEEAVRSDTRLQHIRDVGGSRCIRPQPASGSGSTANSTPPAPPKKRGRPRKQVSKEDRQPEETPASLAVRPTNTSTRATQDIAFVSRQVEVSSPTERRTTGAEHKPQPIVRNPSPYLRQVPLRFTNQVTTTNNVRTVKAVPSSPPTIAPSPSRTDGPLHPPPTTHHPHIHPNVNNGMNEEVVRPTTHLTLGGDLTHLMEEDPTGQAGARKRSRSSSPRGTTESSSTKRAKHRVVGCIATPTEGSAARLRPPAAHKRDRDTAFAGEDSPPGAHVRRSKRRKTGRGAPEAPT